MATLIKVVLRSDFKIAMSPEAHQIPPTFFRLTQRYLITQAVVSHKNDQQCKFG